MLAARDAATGWAELRRALPPGRIQLDKRQRCDHVAAVLETAIGNGDVLGLNEERWWVLAAAASRLRQPPTPLVDRDMDEAERALVEQGVQTVRSRGRTALRGEVLAAVREARRAIEGEPRASKPAAP